MGKRVLKFVVWFGVAMLIFGAGFIYGTSRTFRIMLFASDPEGKLMPLRTQVLVSNLSNLRGGQVEEARDELEVELASSVLSMAGNPVWPEGGRASRDRALGWAKLYYTAYPARDAETAARLNEALKPYSTSGCESNACWASLRRLTTMPSATQGTANAPSMPATAP